MLFKVIFWFSCMAICAYSDENPGGPKLRIIGGEEAEDMYPFMVSLQIYGRTNILGISTGNATYHHICGGSIVGEKCIVTAAHCVNGSMDALSVLVGTNDLDNLGKRYYVQNYTVHPNFSSAAPTDIAVLRLNESMKFSNLVDKIALSKEVVGENIALQVIGWGYTNRLPFGLGQLPSKLQVLNTTSISNVKCIKTFPGTVSEADLCTYQFKLKGQGACNGDSGGPLIRYHNGIAYLAGLVSRGFSRCATYKIPDVFTRCSLVVDWIHQQCGNLVAEEN